MDRLTHTNDETPVLGKEKEKSPLIVYVIAVLAAVGGLLFGYDTGVVSGAMILMRDYFVLGDTMQEIVVSSTIIAAWISCLCAGQLSDRYGRKIVIISASIVFTAGALMMGFASDVYILIAGRVTVGIGIGLASMCVPMYIAEVSPQHLRGTLVTVNNVAVTAGQFLASLVGGAFSYDHETGWRWMLGLASVPAILQLIGFIFMPESPRWLISRGKEEEAKRVLRRVRGSNVNIEVEFNIIRNSCDKTTRDQANDNSSVIRKVLSNSSLRTALLVGCMLQAIQQLSGINTVMYYSASIIEMSGVRDKSRVIWLTAAVTGMNFLCSVIGLLLVDRVGRRKLIIPSLAGVILSLTVLAVSFQLADIHSPPVTYEDPSTVGSVCRTFNDCSACSYNRGCGFCFTDFGNGTLEGTCLVSATYNEFSKQGVCNSTLLPPHVTWAYGWCPSVYSWVTFLGLLLYLFFFSPGMGCMPWTINSEIYPLWARSTCYSIATSVNWLCNFIVSLTFLDLLQALTKYGAFYFYDSLAVLGLIFIFLMLPETKGVSLEDLDDLFARTWWRDTTPHTVQPTPSVLPKSPENYPVEEKEIVFENNGTDATVTEPQSLSKQTLTD